MISHKGKLYIATIDEMNPTNTPSLYSSVDPEIYPWEDVIDSSNPLYDKSKNPNGSISEMIVFNDKIYVSTNNPNGVQVWRTNDSTPKLNDWTLIVDNGFGDAANQYTLSIICPYGNAAYQFELSLIPQDTPAYIPSSGATVKSLRGGE